MDETPQQYTEPILGYTEGKEPLALSDDNRVARV